MDRLHNKLGKTEMKKNPVEYEKKEKEQRQRPTTIIIMSTIQAHRTQCTARHSIIIIYQLIQCDMSGIAGASFRCVRITI